MNMPENLSAKQILTMDSTIIISVGVAQLQKILRTLKIYKELAENQSRILLEKDDRIEELEKEIHRLNHTTFTIRQVGQINLEVL